MKAVMNDYLIRKKIYKYMFTSVLTTVALQLGNVVDAMIVGNLIGSEANAAVSAAIPFVYLLQVAAFLMGTGGAVTIAVLLGERDSKAAGRVMGVCMAASVAYPLIFTFLTPVTVPAYLRLMGLEGTIADMVRRITTVYSLGMPLISLVIAMSSIMSVDSHPTLSSALLVTSNVINLVCDVLLVKLTPLGLTGSTLATVIGYGIGGMIFIPLYFLSKNRMVKPTLRDLGQYRDKLLLTCKNGIPNTVYLVMNMIKVFALNKAVVSILGNDLLSVFAVANNTQQITQMFLNGITAVIASVAGVLYGEKDYAGMRNVFRRVMTAGVTVGAIVTALFLVAPGVLADLYGFRDPALRPVLLSVLRIFALSFIFYVFNCIIQNYYKVIGQTFLSSADSVLELVVLCIPLSVAGMHLYGIKGLFAALIINEMITLAVINLIRIIMQKTGRMPGGDMLAIPYENEGSICEMTVSGSDTAAVDTSKVIAAFCAENGVNEEDALMMRLATEEIIANIAEYGYKDRGRKYIDICLKRTADRIILRFRDDGIPFDPTSCTTDSSEVAHSLEMLKNASLDMKYMRVIDLNNTIFEVRADGCRQGS